MKNFLYALKRFLQENGLVLLLSSAFILYFYSPLLLHPQRFLFMGTGDGLKNYYTFVWYIQNNNLSTEFSGMNYPFGEHILYTDCHPFPAFLLKLLGLAHPFFTDNCIGFLNVALLVSPIFAALILFRIFRNLEINKQLAAASAVGLMLLSPQTSRLTGHLALSYSFCIPLTIYLILKLHRFEERKKILVFIFLNTLFWFTIHPYLGLMAMILTSGFGLIKLFHVEQRKSGFKLLSTGTAAFLAFYIFLIITDHHTGRTNNPWGIYELKASFLSVFIPKYGPIDELISKAIPGLCPSTEGISYIGIISLFTFIGLIIYAIKRIVQPKKSIHKQFISNQFLQQLMIIGILCLLFSMLFPFWWKLEKFLEYFQFVKQFRAIGRFAWIFYYIIGIVAVYKMQEYLKRKEQPYWLSKLAIPFLFLIIPAWESKDYHEEIRSNAKRFNNVFDVEQLSPEIKKSLLKINPNKYQAIIPLPYYYIGSDNHGKTANDSIYRLSTLFSYHLKTPTMAAFLSRTSVSDSKKMMQLTGLNYYPKLIQEDIINDQPFLIIANKSGVSDEEQLLLSRAKLILQSPSFSIHEITVDSLFQDARKVAWEKIAKQSENLALPDDIIYENFDMGSFDGLLSRSSKQIDGGVFTILHTIEKNKFRKDEEYILSMWMNNSGPNFGQDQLSGYCYIEKIYKNKKAWITGSISPTQSTNIFGNWSFVEIHFWGCEPGALYNIMFKRDGHINHPIEIDHLLIRPANKDYRNAFVWKNDSIMHYNGHLIVKP